MDSEERADALEHHMVSQLNQAISGQHGGELEKPKRYPTAADVDTHIETRLFRQCAGFRVVPRTGENVGGLPLMPANPTLLDFFALRFMNTSRPGLQSANFAMRNGMSEEVILACFTTWFRRMVTLNDLYAFDPKAAVTIDPLSTSSDLFKQLKGGLGNDNSSVAHMWRTIARPDQPL